MCEQSNEMETKLGALNRSVPPFVRFGLVFGTNKVCSADKGLLGYQERYPDLICFPHLVEGNWRDVCCIG